MSNEIEKREVDLFTIFFKVRKSKIRSEPFCISILKTNDEGQNRVFA